jgi:hypothetical protein
VLDFEPGSPLKDTAAKWSRHVTYVAGPVEDSLGLAGLLVRPDGVVAWVAGGASDDRGCAAAMAQWFGPE